MGLEKAGFVVATGKGFAVAFGRILPNDDNLFVLMVKIWLYGTGCWGIWRSLFYKFYYEDAS